MQSNWQGGGLTGLSETCDVEVVGNAPRVDQCLICGSHEVRYQCSACQYCTCEFHMVEILDCEAEDLEVLCFWCYQDWLLTLEDVVSS